MSDKGTIEQLRAELVQAREELVQAQTEIARVDKISDGYATGWADACAARDALVRECNHLEEDREYNAALVMEKDRELAQLQRRLAIPDQTCGYCGYRYSAGTNEANFAVLAEHIQSCPKHPLAKALAELAQAQTECNVLAMTFTDANELHAIVRGELTQARAKLKDLQRANRARVEHLISNRNYWSDTCRAAEAERDEIRKGAEGLRRQLAQACVELAAVDGAAVSKLRLCLQDTEIALQAERRLRQEAELAAHVHDKSCGELAQTVRTERALRRDVKRCAKQAEVELSSERQLRREAETRARELESSRDAWRDGRDSVTAELLKVRDWLEKTEQRAEHAEALAAPVTEELAALLARLGDFAICSRQGEKHDYQHWFDEPCSDDPGRALALAARIREALELEATK